MNALPFLYIPPDKNAAPLLVVVPHSGTRIGRAEAARCPLHDTVRLKDSDLGAEKLVDTAASSGAHLLVATVHRWVCDVDRDPAEIDPRICSELATGRAEHPRGVIWRESANGIPCLEGTLSKAEVEARIRTIHTAFHAKIEQILVALVAEYGRARVLDLRAVASIGPKAAPDAGKPRPSVSLLDSGTATADTLAIVAQHFDGARIPVTRQAGNASYLARRHASPGSSVEWIHLQLSRRLYLHEEVPHWAGAPALELQRITRALVDRLAALR